MSETAAVKAEETEIRLDDLGKFVPTGPVLVERNADGTTTSSPLTPPDVSRFEAIHDLIHNIEADPAEISRLIFAELSNIVKDMAVRRNNQTEGYKDKAYAEVVKGLREMGKQLMDTEDSAGCSTTCRT